MERPSESVVELSQSKRELLDLLLAENVETGFVFPASYSQEQLWFLDQLEPGQATYNVIRSVRLTGDLNITALEQSVREIANRHEALRTSFRPADGRPVQMISPTTVLTMPVVDVSHLGGREGGLEGGEMGRLEASRPFDLGRTPLMRVTLGKLREDEHLFVVVMHHIVSDGWSVAVFTQELMSLYESYSKGESSKLQQLEIQYADYAAWQREYLQGEVLERRMNYWKQHLEGAPPVLQLPTDRARPPVQTYRGGSQRFGTGAELLERLTWISRKEAATVYMLLMA